MAAHGSVGRVVTAGRWDAAQQSLAADGALACFSHGCASWPTDWAQPELAHALWKTNVYEARVIALLVDDPARTAREQAEKQVGELAGGMLAYVFASCDATLAKTSFVVELADQWVRSDDPVRRDCGYGLLYEASKFSSKKAPSEEFLLAHVERIADTIGTESEKVRLSMGAALKGIGKRSAVLNEAALKVARNVGPIEFTRQWRVRADQPRRIRFYFRPFSFMNIRSYFARITSHR